MNAFILQMPSSSTSYNWAKANEFKVTQSYSNECALSVWVELITTDCYCILVGLFFELPFNARPNANWMKSYKILSNNNKI